MKFYYQHYRQPGQQFTVALAVSEEEVAIGVAYVGGGDTFCKRTGRSIAAQRARQVLDRKKTYACGAFDVLSKRDGEKVLGARWNQPGALTMHPKDLFERAEVNLRALSGDFGTTAA